MTSNQAITIDSNTAFASNVHEQNVYMNHAPSLEQVLILDHVAMLLQYLSYPASNADGKNSNMDDKYITARINGLLKRYWRH